MTSENFTFKNGVSTPIFSDSFFVFGISTCLITSILGTICNIYLLVKFLARKEKPNGFQKICLIKTIPNIIVCTSFVFWVVPTTALSLTNDQLPYRLNSMIGLMAGNWSYVLTPMLQVCMACNRFYVLYFPFGIKAVKSIHVTEIFIAISVIFVTILSSFNIPEGCAYFFDPEYFQWRSEYGDCSNDLTDVFLYSIIILAAISNSFNVATAVRLVTMRNKMVGINKKEAEKRRSRWLKMFTQSVIQDCFHRIDILNTVYFWKLSVDAWFQFLCLTLSFIVIYTLDGIVMLICHKDVHPTWCKKMMNRNATASNSIHVVVHS